MKKINRIINDYLGLILLISVAAGLLVPYIKANNSLIIILALGCVIFVSYFQISLNREIFSSDLRTLPAFYIFRFLILPVIVYYIFIWWSSFYAVAFFLLLLLPAAVSSPAFTAIFGGNIALSLKIVIISSFAAIITVPGLCHWIIARQVPIDSNQMFLIMIYTIVVPFIFHLPFRTNKIINQSINDGGPLITVIGLTIIIVVSTSKNKDIILSDPKKMLLYAGISVLFYLCLYLIGFFIMSRQEPRKRISFSVSSGANNIGIGVTLTMLFFPGEMNVFFIVSQISWIFVLIPMRYFYKRL